MNSYHVLSLVGEGSFGRVYKGRRKGSGMVVALKFMPKLGRSENQLRSLKREIEIMRDLRHPNIVQLFDSFETETEVVIVTEYAEGQLFQILEDDGNLPESQVREIACQLVSALYYLHSHRILHRDMKPQNILLEKSGVVKLCDFGFARAMSVSTLVLTSIKGTPLYMSPELVEEKPYDHTADLWSLGCILYELHTGAPPFYTNSIFKLVQLIVKDQVKWPETMSSTCTSFLKGLLTKDPQKRLSWPDLLYHPFVADGVLVLPATNVSRPLTVTPSPDMLALKLQQVAEKTVPASAESRLLRKVREQTENCNKRKPPGSDSAKKNKDGRENGAMAAAMSPRVCNPKPSRGDVSVISGQLDMMAANQSLGPKIQASSTSKHRGQISIDYEREFPSIEIGPRLVRRCREESHTSLQLQDVNNKEYWENLAELSDPSRQTREILDYSIIISQIKSKIQAFKAQLKGGVVKEVQQIQQPMRVLHNLLVMAEVEKLNHVGRELGLPCVLFGLIQDTVESSDFIKHQQSIPVLQEMITVILIYWEKNCAWVEQEQSLEEFTKSFKTILSQPNLSRLVPLAASVLSLFTQHNVDVEVDVEHLICLLKTLVLDPCEPHISPPSGWGLCDGLLSLFLDALNEHENGPLPSGLNPVFFLNLWKKIGASLEGATSDSDFCSANGLYFLLSALLFVFTKDPRLCIPLFCDVGSECVYALGRLLGTECLHLFAKGNPGRPRLDLSHNTLSTLSCHLLCFPFALDLPPHTMSTVLQLYDSCGIVTSLLQVIQTLPLQLLELPLSLLSRLLLCDPPHSIDHLTKAASCFFSPSWDDQLPASSRQSRPTRTASSLLLKLLQLEILWEAALELLTLLSCIARCPSCPFQLYVETSVLQHALAHSNEQIRAATCRFLGNLDPFRPLTQHTLQPDIFKAMINCLNDSCVPVRQVACRSVGNWLGCIAAGLHMDRSNEKGIYRGRCCTGKHQNKQRYSDIEAASDLETIREQRMEEVVERRWTHEARRTVAMLVSLICDPDALTRRHCCAALGNLLNVDGAVSLLLEENVPGLLLRTACTDSHSAVRKAAIGSLYLYSQQDAMRQVLMSLDASKKLVQTSHHAPPQCDYQRLIGQLTPPEESAA
ncbi:serine/threonine-protein kinase 36 isoform X1 [Oreochromis niloticus]|uniref:serine/threonine-protein kinase 36 isoform X1 n=1 Tax=Oreochromis niloticus TaxID=8128 RepID=UPI000905954A|nr:serine/threonine-protein kinase 36 isoform X1 [Oreochromis niloticus]